MQIAGKAIDDELPATPRPELAATGRSSLAGSAVSSTDSKGLKPSMDTPAAAPKSLRLSRPSRLKVRAQKLSMGVYK